MPDTATTNATCSEEFDWMFNSLGQSPCVVTSSLWSTCGDGCLDDVDCNIPPALSPGTTYTRPSDSDFTLGVCTCSTVWYSTLAACAVCQGRRLAIDPWLVYSDGCGDSLAMEKFPSGIPNGTAVPGWAFLPIANDTFDVNTAHTLAALHPAENEAPAVIPGQLSSTPAPSSSSPTPIESAAPTVTQNSKAMVSKKNLAGIIAGSVVAGGVIFVTLTVFAFFYIRRRRRALYAEKLDNRHNVLPPPDSEAAQTSPDSANPSQLQRKSTATRSTYSSDHTVLTDVAGFPVPPPPTHSAFSPTSPAKAFMQSVVGAIRPSPTEGTSHALPQESDSGWREGRGGTLPPPYTAD